jgi:SAM-dependent methyltransferase
VHGRLGLGTRSEDLLPGSDEGPDPPASLGDHAARDSRVTSSAREHWDREAEGYDRWREHGAWSAGERAAWAATLRRLLPRDGKAVLDVGAGTGFVSLAAARLGYRVTALDISADMLERLATVASREGLEISTVHAPATEPPTGPFDAVIERLTLPLLPDPEAAAAAWLAVAPAGRLVAFEAMWTGRDYTESLRRRARNAVHRLRRLPPEHAPYDPAFKAQLPLIDRPTPSTLVDVIHRAGWSEPGLERLRDVEWARLVALPPFDRLLGVTPEYVITAAAAPA